MKKLFALMLALCMMLGTAALADELVWEGTIADAASQIEGEFHTFDEIAVKIWIPAVLKEVELTDEDKEKGQIGYFETEDKANAVGVQYVNMNGTSLDEYKAILLESGIEENTIEPGTVNGLDCLSYEYNGNGILAFTTQKGFILEVAGGPLSDEGFASLLTIIMGSIQSAE